MIPTPTRPLVLQAIQRIPVATVLAVLVIAVTTVMQAAGILMQDAYTSIVK
jgi:hypothetical protein